MSQYSNTNASLAADTTRNRSERIRAWTWERREA